MGGFQGTLEVPGDSAASHGRRTSIHLINKLEQEYRYPQKEVWH